MSIDANVLIFERIREEQTAGKDLKAAIDTGFKKALSSIKSAEPFSKPPVQIKKRILGGEILLGFPI